MPTRCSPTRRSRAPETPRTRTCSWPAPSTGCWSRTTDPRGTGTGATVGFRRQDIAVKRGLALFLVIVVAGLLIALWRSGSDARRGSEPRPATTEPSRTAGTSESPLVPAPAVSPSETPPAQERVELPENATPKPEAEPAPARAKPVAHVRGRCVDGAVQPLAQVEITGPGLDRARRSAADGTFELELDLAGAQQE